MSDSESTKTPGGCTGKGFPPGVSGNPSGRPKGSGLKARLREYLDSREVPAADGIGTVTIGDNRTVADLIVEGLVEAARAGKVGAFLTILKLTDETDGPAAADARSSLLDKAEAKVLTRTRGRKKDES